MGCCSVLYFIAQLLQLLVEILRVSLFNNLSVNLVNEFLECVLLLDEGVKADSEVGDVLVKCAIVVDGRLKLELLLNF